MNVRLADGESIDFDDDVVAKWDANVLEVVQDHERWTFPLANVAYFVTAVTP